MSRNTKLFLSVILAGVLACGAVVAVFLSTFLQVPDFSGMLTLVEVPIKLANGTKSTRMMGPQAPGWAAFSQISDDLITAVISSEDTSFYSHQGVDFHEMKESLKKDLVEKRWARGGSTITQQVIKNVYLSPEKSLWRKLKEVIWARELDKQLTKQQVLCFYLNMAEWGPGIYGIREAAQHYFAASPAQLNPKQGAFLAMLIPSPVKYHNAYFPKKKLTKWASSRVNHILKIMSAMGYLDTAQYEAALHQSLWGEVPDASAEGLDDEIPPIEGDTDLPDAGVPAETSRGVKPARTEKPVTLNPDSSPVPADKGESPTPLDEPTPETTFAPQ